MPVTSLNRIVATLIVGSVPIFWLLLRVKLEFNLSTWGPVSVGLAFVAAAIVFGVLIDAIGEIVLSQTIVKRARRSKRVAKVFRQLEMHNYFVQWMRFFDNAVKGSKLDLRTTADVLDEFDIIRLEAIGIFFKEAGKENFEWMTGADALYYLSSNLAILTILLWGAEVLFLLAHAPTPCFGLVASTAYTAGTLILLYILIGRAINRDLYTDLIIFRFSTLYCLDRDSKEEEKARVSDTSPT
jgi:hypothetical protein